MDSNGSWASVEHNQYNVVHVCDNDDGIHANIKKYKRMFLNPGKKLENCDDKYFRYNQNKEQEEYEKETNDPKFCLI